MTLLRCLLVLLLLSATQAAQVEVASLTYGGGKTSKCFSPAFLELVAKDARIPTNPAFLTIPAADATQLGRTPFALLAGEGAFTLSAAERTTLKGWLERGGFLIASAGCSSPEWSASLRRELGQLFGSTALVRIGQDHPLFHTLYDLGPLTLKKDGTVRFEGILLDGRLAVLFSPEGLNDTAKVSGCCCCGGNEITNARQVVANALVYALVE